MRWRGVVLDFDGTLVSDQGRLTDPATIAALQSLRDAGYLVVLNTGRTLGYLYGPEGIQRLQDLRLFDAVIAEGGTTIWFPRRSTPPQAVASLNTPLLIAAMRRAGVPATEIWPGAASIGTISRYHPAVAKQFGTLNAELRRYKVAPITVHHIINGSSVVYLPPGVDKGSGMLAALDEMGVNAGQMIGIGDGENDFDFLKHCGVAFALGNARPGLLASMRSNGVGMQVSGSDAAGVRQIISALLRGEVSARGLAA